MSKRSWESDGSAGDFKRKRENHDTQPSKVIHVRNVADGTREFDLINAVNNFGKVSYVTLMANKRQALIEFEDVESAINLITYAKSCDLPVNGRVAYFNYSVSTTIKRAGNVGEAYLEYSPNKIILLTVLNAKYPITVHVLHTICQRHGAVQRIVIFHKNGVQALVEYATTEQAMVAKEALDGADIYEGCCTLKIEFSKAERVNVYENNDESCDFTGAVLESRGGPRPLLERGQGSFGAGPGNPHGHYAGATPSVYNPYSQPPQQRHQPFVNSPSMYPQQAAGLTRSAGPGGEAGAVVMVHNLVADRISCDMLFNVFCAYGNVVRIKILIKKLGSALVQMDSKEAAGNAIGNLDETSFMGQDLSLSFSHHSAIEDRGIGQLPNGSLAVVDYLQSRNNRFQSAEQSRKNLMIPPTKTLHFFNAPPMSNQESLQAVFTAAGAPIPDCISVFAPKGETGGSAKCRGLMSWSTSAQALEAMAICNHTTMNPGGQAYTLKFAFTLANHQDSSAGNRQ